MALTIKIIDIHARQILDSRGNPTVEAEVTAQTETTGRKSVGRESVPSGASTGQFEAIELRDGVEAYFGLGVEKVVSHINERIRQELMGTNAKRWPMPMMNVINGGAHAKNSLDFQEFMIVPVGADDFAQALRMGAEVYHFLRQILHEDGLLTAVGDEGGFAPDFADAKEVFAYLSRAVEKAGYQVGADVAFAMDAATSELYHEEDGMYHFQDGIRSAEELISLYEDLIQNYPLISIEDGLDEDDWEGWQKMTTRLGKDAMLVGDDLFVTNVKRIHCGIDLAVANAVLIKVNQIGTLTEAMDAIELAQKSGYKAIISHRSGETEDTFIADLAVAVNAGWIKTGAPCRGERTAKYNQLLRIGENL